MKLSISNLSWGEEPIETIAPKLSRIGMHGIEIAPSAVWGDIESVSTHAAVKFTDSIEMNGLEISGLQSLLYGHPEFQLFNESCWPAMQEHLRKTFSLGGKLGANVAVFGSPKNRIRNTLNVSTANQMAVDFFSQLIPTLQENNIVLTLEPNASKYGADYLVNYREVIELVGIINSPWIGPQIDTGCALLENDPLLDIYELQIPRHIHLSAPDLLPLPSSFDLRPFLEVLNETNYQEWLVIEILGKSSEASREALRSAEWLVKLVGGVQDYK
jgi:sugar phosphate isomerase/epimerase